MIGFNTFLCSLKEEPEILLDSKSDFYLNINQFFKSAQNNIKITRKLVNTTSIEIIKSNNGNSDIYLKHYSSYDFKEQLKGQK